MIQYYWVDTLGNRMSRNFNSWLEAYKAKRATWANYTIKEIIV